jgi:hypothetical protein
MSCFVEDDDDRGGFPDEYGDGSGYLKDEVCAGKADMVGSSKGELDEKNTDEGESDAGEKDLYGKGTGKDGAIKEVRISRVATVVDRVSEGNVVNIIQTHYHQLVEVVFSRRIL